MNSFKVLLVWTLVMSARVYGSDDQEALLRSDFDSDAEDKALKKMQPTDTDDAIALVRAYFDIAARRVFSVRLAKDAEFQKSHSEKEIQSTSDLSKINHLRKNSVKMQSLKNSVVASHDDVLVKEKRIFALKSLGTNSIYKSKKANFDNIFARLEVLVKKASDELSSKANDLMSRQRSSSSAYIASTSQLVKNFLQESSALRMSLENLIKPAAAVPVATASVAAPTS